jgi:hypothetical protein
MWERMNKVVEWVGMEGAAMGGCGDQPLIKKKLKNGCYIIVGYRTGYSH